VQAGEWELALQLFGRMSQDGVRPNTITFNSLITACAQGMCEQPKSTVNA
jgi:pentatricopeptide repeat domain-containing protein 1